MILYFSSEKNKHILDKSREIIGADVKVENETYISSYLNKNMNSLNHIDFLAIDIDYIIDEEEEILNALSAFRIFQSSIEIIIVSLDRGKGDILLGKIFSKGIYNFITSKDETEQETEVRNCILKQNNYSTAIGYEIDISQPKEKEKSNVIKNIFGNLKKEKQRTKEKQTSEEIENIKLNRDKKVKNFKKSSLNLKLKTADKVENTEKIEHHFSNLEERFSNKKHLEKNDFGENEETRHIENLEEQINEIFGNSNFCSETNQKKERDTLVLEEISHNISILFYYNKKIGIYDKSNGICLIDTNFSKEEIKNYLESVHINYSFREDIYSKIKSLKI